MSSPVEQIKQRLNVVDVVGSYIKLQKAGANFKAICPFHSEKAPSFYISPAREIWHCFGCGAGGDMFEFVKQIEGVEFVEALRLLAERSGIRLRVQDQRFKNERTGLLDLLKEATIFYQRQLIGNKKALNYLWKRGLNNETLKNFNIGFAPTEEGGWRNLLGYLKSKGYSENEIEKAGLIIKKSSADYYDRFRNRIMFPLKDASGRIVGFSGRIFGPEKEGVGKYINTPQTILYDKSKLLYGFDRAKIEIRKKDVCILVEGQMDVLMSHQAGIINAVAVSGTALTPLHLQFINRLTNNLIMAFDNDEAGLLAAKRSIDLALEKELEVLVASLPQGQDPADIIFEDSDLWKKTVEKPTPIIEFYLNILKEKHGDSLNFKQQVGKNVLPYLLSIESEIAKSHWIKEIAKRLGVREEVIWGEFRKIYRKETPSMPTERVGIEKTNRRQLLKEHLAGIVLWKNDKTLIPDFVKNPVFDIFKKAKKDYRSKLAFEAELYYSGAENLEEEIGNLAKELKKELTKGQLENLAEEIRKLETEGKSSSAKATKDKLNEFQKLSKELAEI